MTRLEIRSARRPRWRIAMLVLLLHGVAVAGLIRAFTPDLADRVQRSVMQAFTIDAAVPPVPPPAPSPKPVRREEDAVAASPGPKATPRPAAAVPRAPIAIRPTEAPPAMADDTNNASGARDRGEGSGASGMGSGMGAGARGVGGGRGGRPTVKIAGDINSARDYPRGSRARRIGASVTIDLTVGRDGQPTACRVIRASPDPGADAITCELAVRRFRFEAATDAAGNPVEATYRWRQRWFY